MFGYWNIFINAIITAIAGGVIGFAISKWNENNAQSQASKCLMRKEIILLVDKCIKQGYVTNEEMEQLQDYNNCYKRLGGNSFVKALMIKAEDLHLHPIRDKEDK